MRIKSLLITTISIAVFLAASSLLIAGERKKPSPPLRTMDEKEEKKSQDQLLKKLSFLYSCKVKEYQFQCLKEKIGMFNKSCSEYGISGCGNKFIYTKMGGTWILTSSNLQGLYSTSIDGVNPYASTSYAMQMSISQQSHYASQSMMMAHQAALNAHLAAHQAAMAATPPPN